MTRNETILREVCPPLLPLVLRVCPAPVVGGRRVRRVGLDAAGAWASKKMLKPQNALLLHWEPGPCPGPELLALTLVQVHPVSIHTGVRSGSGKKNHGLQENGRGCTVPVCHQLAQLPSRASWLLTLHLMAGHPSLPQQAFSSASLSIHGFHVNNPVQQQGAWSTR